MPNNVYIGSRYVPLFDGDWDSTKNYEGLTIVNYNGSSYTSKRPVPAGTLPTNTTYWALTGNYNGQISNLQQQIDNITADIGNIANLTTNIVNAINSVNSEQTALINTVNHMVKQPSPSRIVCITDSYGTHSTTNWCTVLADLFGLSGDNFYYWAEGSSGFEHTGLSGHTFLTLLQAHISDIDSPETISDVFIGGGTNDFYYFTSFNNLVAAMSNMAEYLKTTFPNAKLHYVFMGYDTIMSSALRGKYSLTIGAYESMKYRKNIDVINAYEPMHIGALREDHQHPSVGGSTEIARCIYCKYFDSSYNIENQSDDLTITPASGLAIANNKMWIDIAGNSAVVRINNLLVDGTISINNNTIIELGTISNRLGQSIGNAKTASRMATIMKYKDSNNNPGTAPIAFFVEADTSDNTLHLYAIITDFGTRTLSEFKIPACDFTFPLIYC